MRVLGFSVGRAKAAEHGARRPVHKDHEAATQVHATCNGLGPHEYRPVLLALKLSTELWILPKDPTLVPPLPFRVGIIRLGQDVLVSEKHIQADGLRPGD